MTRIAHATGVEVVAPGEQQALDVGAAANAPRRAARPSARSEHDVDRQPPQADLERAVDRRRPAPPRPTVQPSPSRRRSRRGPATRCRSSIGRTSRATYRRRRSSRPNRTATLPPMRPVPERLDRGRSTPRPGAVAGGPGSPTSLDALAGADLDVEIHAVGRRRPTSSRCARDAFDRGRGVVACGGDGTVCALAGVAADARRRARHRARRARATTSPASSRSPATTSTPRSTCCAPGTSSRADLGRVAHRRRRDARGSPPSPTPASTPTPTVGQPRSPGRAARPLYVLATLRTLATYRPRRFRVTVDDTVDRDRRVAGRGGQHAHATRAG